jgi:hypothetical protein
MRTTFHYERRLRLMKTMTCKQMGGPCDAAFHGNKADEVIKAEDKHLKEMVASGDETHKSALKMMQGRWKNPIKGMGWYMKTKTAFAALPED